MPFSVLTQMNPVRSSYIFRTARLLSPSDVPKVRKLNSWAKSEPDIISKTARRRDMEMRPTSGQHRPTSAISSVFPPVRELEYIRHGIDSKVTTQAIGPSYLSPQL